MKFTRRQIIMGGVAGLVAVPTAYTLKMLAFDSPEAFLKKIPADLYDAEIGHMFLMQYPGTFEKNKLFEQLKAKLNSDHMRDSSYVYFALKKAAIEDYKHDRMVDVQGWMLPEISAWLCVLAALVKA